MTQSTPIIGANQSGLSYRQQDNDGKKALLNHHKGSSAPSYAEAGMIWLDDTATPWSLKTYDGADWITLGDINASNNTFSPYVGAAAIRLTNDAADTGTANAYALAPIPAFTAYTTGMIVTLRPSNANTGAATININSLGAKNIKLMDGSNPASGAIATTGIYILIYDGTNFVLTNPTNAGTYVLLDTKTASSSTSLNFTTGITTAYSAFVFVFENLQFSTSADLRARISQDAGSTWKSANSTYKWTTRQTTTDAATPTTTLAGSSSTTTRSYLQMISASGSTIDGGKVEFFQSTSTGLKRFAHNLYVSAGDECAGFGFYIADTNAINGVQFYPSTGNFPSGKVYLYGIKNT